MKNTFVLVIMTFLGISGYSQVQKDISMFPDAPEGYKKVMIFLPEKKKSNLLNIEITVGKEVEVDKCNTYFLMGNLKENELSSYGYSYYDFKSDGNIAGTKMGCPDEERELKFVTGQSKIIDYNSKLPIVIYIPSDMSVKYRVWKTKSKWVCAR